MFCTNCGANTSATQKFCGSCGSPVQTQESLDKLSTFGQELFRIRKQTFSTPAEKEGHLLKSAAEHLHDIVVTSTSIFLSRSIESDSKIGKAATRASMLLGPAATLVTGAISSALSDYSAERKHPAAVLSESNWQEQVMSGHAIAIPKNQLQIIDVQIKPSFFDGAEHYVKISGVFITENSEFRSKIIISPPFASGHLPDSLRRNGYAVESIRLKDAVKFYNDESRGA